jgi:chromosome segregation ATPase
MSAFPTIGQPHHEYENEGAFWPSFTDIMMVVVLIFLLATSLLIVRNWHLVNELQHSMEAEKLATQMIETTSLENATLEERLINAEQMISILRLRIMEKKELLRAAEQTDKQRMQTIAALEQDKQDLKQLVESTRGELAASRLTISEINAESQEFANQLAELRLQLDQEIARNQIVQRELELANAQIAALNDASEQQLQSIRLLEQEKIDYNRQLLTLKGDYEVVKSKYEQLIKPARSAKGKYVAEVYYVKEKDDKKVIRFKEPHESAYRTLPLAKVESRLQQLKQEKGADLYVKIIIPKNSGLTYNEAWNFMKSLLDKYDYYYQQSDNSVGENEKPEQP